LSDPSDDLRAYTPGGNPATAVVNTLEFRHPAFVDDAGQPAAARVVHAHAAVTATLEAGAPADGGQAVVFQPLAFTARLPEQGSSGSPSCDIVVANVARILVPYLEKAALNPAPIEVTYRQYLSSELSAPAWVVGGLMVKTSHAGITRVTATAGYEDFVNKPHCANTYTTAEFPGLDR
jgi:hypothetical protein